MWNEKYRDGIKTRGDKIGMDLCIIKPLNDVRRKFSADHLVTQALYCHLWFTSRRSNIINCIIIIITTYTHTTCTHRKECMYMLVYVFSCLIFPHRHTTIVLILGGNIGLVLPVGIVVCRELPSHSCKDPSLSCLLLFLCHPYISRSTIRRIFYLLVSFLFL